MFTGRHYGSALPCLWLVRKRSGAAGCENSEALYYPSYRGDRFGGGIGQRVGVDEHGCRPVGDTGVVRVAVFSETHERLRAWATEENWREATRIHKAAYFTRSENLVQEAVLERLRQHYVAAGTGGYVARAPVQAALFRLEDLERFRQKCGTTKVVKIPLVVRGVYDERAERCIVDFANKRLGGGWLSYGMAQEEKLFVERFDLGALCAQSLLEMPDPVQAPLASPFSMHAREAWLLKGAPAFAHLPWYGRTPPEGLERLQLLNPEEDQATAPTVVAIDAIKASFSCYEPQHLELMLAKAYTGFVAATADADLGGARRIATGAWGCGAFFNGERVMFVVQALAANLAGVELAYHVVVGPGGRGSPPAHAHIGPALAFVEEALLHGWTVRETLERLAQHCAADPAWRSKHDPLRPPPRAPRAPTSASAAPAPATQAGVAV